MKVFRVHKYGASTWGFYTDGGRRADVHLNHQHLFVSVYPCLPLDGCNNIFYTVYIVPLTVKPDDQLHPYRADIEATPLNLELFLEERAARRIAVELGIDPAEVYQLHHEQPLRGIQGTMGITGFVGIQGTAGTAGVIGFMGTTGAVGWSAASPAVRKTSSRQANQRSPPR